MPFFSVLSLVFHATPLDNIMWGLGTLPEGENYKLYIRYDPIANTFCIFLGTGFPAAAYAAYAAGRGYSGYPSFGLPYPTGKCGTHPHRHNDNHQHTHTSLNLHTYSYILGPLVHYLYVSESVKQPQ